MTRNFTRHGFSKKVLAGKEQDAETFTIEVLIDPLEDVWEAYKGIVVRGWYMDGSDHWDVCTSVDKDNGRFHWRSLSMRKNYRRMMMVINCIKHELKKVAA